MTCNAMVVLPEDSGPKISTTRPRGKPPTPSAASNEIAPVEITEIGTIASFEPNRIIEPLPNCFSICANAKSIARFRSSAMKFSCVARTPLSAKSRETGCEYILDYKRRKGESQNFVGKVPEKERDVYQSRHAAN